ncbi:DUF982 domain-containing protein [Rhizobium lusitanum]|uniref:DUF982 domain-containing protein n=1 Tax=Rhizobium lusitanum TaxID=293958 RepID=A0A6L9UAQ7_9HYPH|nr:DUF982 domain-containing protein [Rhizobium lusitanum]NEI73115.1 DUF982 domain-containing protein [Rhizobium lusitanum]
MQWWKQPVIIKTNRLGERMVIESTEGATDFLLSHWPQNSSGYAFTAAKVVLLEAFDGKRQWPDARQALIAALNEANIAFSEG